MMPGRQKQEIRPAMPATWARRTEGGRDVCLFMKDRAGQGSDTVGVRGRGAGGQEPHTLLRLTGGTRAGQSRWSLQETLRLRDSGSPR